MEMMEQVAIVALFMVKATEWKVYALYHICISDWEKDDDTLSQSEVGLHVM